MAEYEHGVYGTEEETELTSMQTITDGITISIGVSPIHKAAKPEEVNKPVLCYEQREAVRQLGSSNDIKTYTNCETVKLLFETFKVSPVVFINVFDPRKHKKDIEEEKTITEGAATIAAPVLLDTMKVTGKEEQTIMVPNSSTYTTAVTYTTVTNLVEVTLIEGEDYEVSINDDEDIVIKVTNGEKAADGKINVSYVQPDPSKVTKEDIIGEIDGVTGKCTGIKLVSEVYARYGILSGILIAPGWSQYPEVAAALAAEAEKLDDIFMAVAPVDLDTNEIEGYGQAAEWKNKNGYVNKFEIACYPMVKLGDTLYHGSTYLAGLMNSLDSKNDGIPYNSPSNKAVPMSGMYNENGEENYFGRKAANHLNGNGIVTFLNFNGWKVWGNRTAVYPQTGDPKDNFISIRRMFNYVNNYLIINFWSKIDDPTNRRLIDDVINRANTWFAGLTARGALLGGRAEFLEADNQTSELMDGKLKFRVWITPPSPARKIEFISQYDPEYLSTLFATTD